MFGMFGAFDPGFYPKIARQSIGRSVGFILVFVLIISALVSIKYTFVALSGLSIAKKWVVDNMPKLASELPAISVDKGSIVEPKKVFIKEYGKQFALIVEPDAQNASAAIAAYPNAALLTQQQLITKQTNANSASADIKTYNLENRSFTITPGADGFKVSFEQRQFDIVPKAINRIIDIGSMFIFPVLLIIWFSIYSFTKPLHVFLFSLVSLVIMAVLKTRLTYKELWNIGVYALVPATCLAAFMDILGLRILFFPLFYSLLYVCYLYMAIKAVGQTTLVDNSGK